MTEARSTGRSPTRSRATCCGGCCTPTSRSCRPPSTRAYYRINPATAAKAFQQLVEEGVIYKRRGIGMFVSPTAQQALRAQRRQHFFADIVDPMVAEARAIGIPLTDIVEHIRQLADTTKDDNQ